MQAKKRKSQDSVIIDSPKEPQNNEKKKQATISCFFKKPEQNVKKVECRKSKESDECLKRKLEEFKASEESDNVKVTVVEFRLYLIY